MPELEYHPGAKDEVVAAHQWYDQIDKQVAKKFKIELARAEALVMRAPTAWGPYFHGTRGYRLRGFPFVLAFMLEEARVIVIALAHTRRQPGYWKKRI